MEKVKPVPHFVEDKPTIMMFPGWDRGDVRIHKDGSVEWSRSRDGRWLSLSLSKDLGQAIYESTSILIGLSRWMENRIRELQDRSSAVASPPDASSAARNYHEERQPHEIHKAVKQGVEYPGGQYEVRLGDDGAVSVRHDYGSWQPFQPDDKVKEPLHIVRRSCTNLILVESQQRGAYEKLLQTALAS